MIYLDAPDGFSLPEGVKPGAKFEAVASLTMGKDGRICLKELDGKEVGSEKEEDDDESEDEKESSGGFLDKMEQTFTKNGMGRGQMM